MKVWFANQYMVWDNEDDILYIAQNLYCQRRAFIIDNIDIVPKNRFTKRFFAYYQKSLWNERTVDIFGKNNTFAWLEPFIKLKRRMFWVDTQNIRLFVF